MRIDNSSENLCSKGEQNNGWWLKRERESKDERNNMIFAMMEILLYKMGRTNNVLRKGRNVEI